MGISNTAIKVSERFYWHNTYGYIDKIATCDKCQGFEKIKKTVSEDLVPIQTNGTWHKLGLDLIGPFRETADGNKYVITLTDLFSKWVEAAPINQKSADNVAQVLCNLFFRFSPPNKIITDQGWEFVNDLNEKLFTTFKIQHPISSAYHSQTNGQDERTNRTIKTALFKLVNSDKSKWDDYINPIIFAINTD